MKKEFVFSYDLGTSGVKAALVTLEGRVVETATADYALHIPAPDMAEQDPADYWEGVCTATKLVLRKTGASPESVAGIAFGTQWKGIIPIDKEGRVMHRSIIWMDARGAAEAELLNAHFGTDAFSASDLWPRLWWLRRNKPHLIDDAAVILEANGYLKWRATGNFALDIGDCVVRSHDAAQEDFYREILALCEVPQEKFPRLVDAHEQVGTLTEGAAAEMGLVAGIPVFGGNSDIGAVAVGAGEGTAGGVHAYFGSSGWIGYVVPHKSREVYIAPLDRERDIALFSNRAIGLSFNWAVDRFYGAEKAAIGGRVFAFVDNDINDIPAGSAGVLATPWFYGDRPPLLGDEARASFLNLGAEHDRRHMTRAVLEGVCYQIRMGMEHEIATKGFVVPPYLTAVGGGASSPLWMQILADVLNIPVRVTKEPRHAGAVGTAYAALIGLGVCADYAEAAERVAIAATYTPKKENVAVYNRGYAVFRTLYKTLSPVFALNKA